MKPLLKLYHVHNSCTNKDKTLPMHVGALLLHTPSASLSPSSLHVEVVKATSDNPYPLSQEYVQTLSKLLSFVQTSWPLVGAVFAGLHVSAAEGSLIR